MENAKVIVVGAKGRMGSLICDILKDSAKHQVDLIKVDSDITVSYSKEVRSLDLVSKFVSKGETLLLIDFTNPRCAVNSAEFCQLMEVPLVVGTTGLKEDDLEVFEQASQVIPIVLAPNMSLGMNLMFKVVALMAELLGPDYDLEVLELHHRKKKDAPSGSAMKLGAALAETRNGTIEEVGKFHRQGMIGERTQDEIGMQTIRGGDIVGEHRVFFCGPGERLELTHMVQDRITFAKGAVVAAEWLLTERPKPGIYGMDAVLGLAEE